MFHKKNDEKREKLTKSTRMQVVVGIRGRTEVCRPSKIPLKNDFSRWIGNANGGVYLIGGAMARE